MMPDPQQSVIAFLADPATHGGTAVTRIDTHAASVFLAGPRALKIKRCVQFPFLDFSMLAKRKAACEAELSVNRAFAPALYRRVVAITRDANGRLALGGGGTPVEWAVEMARFDETQTLDHLAAGRIDAALADRLARAVAGAHDAARPVHGFRFADALATIVEQNDTELRNFPNLFDAGSVTALTQSTREALKHIRQLLDARERGGLVRRCHGDLHLGNLVLIDGEPVLFDAIEFDERIATADVLYDLAFLLMDLWTRDLRAAANVVLNRYLAETRHDADLDALAALPLFLSTRAAIRAKVTAEREAADAGGGAQSARDYFALARRLIAPPSPRLVAIGGLSGTGKSALARALAADVLPAPGAVVLRSDQERKALSGVTETERLHPDAYTEAAAAQVYAALRDKARRVLHAGQSAIIDAVFARAHERETIAAGWADASFTGLFLTAGLDTRVARVAARAADASDADAGVARQQEGYDLGRLDWVEVDASGTPAETLAGARAVLERG